MHRHTATLTKAGGSLCAFSLAVSAPRRLFALLVLSASLCWGSFAESSPAASPSGSAPGSQEIAPQRSSASELERLVEISKKLVELNERLKSELESSRSSSAGLAASLESSMLALEALRSELEASRQTSSELAASAETSVRESSELREALRKADDSLRSLEKSFKDYRKAAEARIRRAERGNLFLGLAAALGWALAAFVFALR